VSQYHNKLNLDVLAWLIFYFESKIHDKSKLLSSKTIMKILYNKKANQCKLEKKNGSCMVGRG